MNLEQRVQMLEQEVQLLKAQIQATLLDMQEQLLNNKYPILRAEESPNAANPIIEAPAAPPAASPSPIKRVALTEPDPDEQVDVRPVRTVISAASLDDDLVTEPPVVQQPVVRAHSNGHHPVPAAEAPKPAAPAWEPPKPRPQRPVDAPKPARPEPVNPAAPDDDTDSHDWIELENWVSQKVEKLGIARTRELINLYTRQERFSRQERELLLQFVNIYNNVPKSPTQQKPSASATAPRPSIVPQTRAVVDEIRTELRHKRAAAKNQNESYRLSEQQELVMRLIAGILSAGDEDTPSSTDF